MKIVQRGFGTQHPPSDQFVGEEIPVEFTFNAYLLYRQNIMYQKEGNIPYPTGIKTGHTGGRTQYLPQATSSMLSGRDNHLHHVPVIDRS